MNQRLLGWMCLGLVSCCMTLEGFAQTSSESLGLLLYSPSQREAIVMARRGQAVESPVSSSASSFRVDGVIRPAKAAGSVWINGELLSEGQKVGELRVETQDMAVRMSGGSRLKVGQSVSATGEGGTKDLLEEGSFSLGGAPSKRHSQDAQGLRLSQPTAGSARGRP